MFFILDLRIFDIIIHNQNSFTMKKLLFLFALISMSILACNPVNAQLINKASYNTFSLLPITAASNTSTATLSGSGDSVFLKSGLISGAGDLTVSIMLLAALPTYTITGTCDLYGSMDGITFVKAYPTVTLTTQAVVMTPIGTGAAAQNPTISINYFLPAQQAMGASQTNMASINGTISGSPTARFNYYIAKIIQTTGTASTAVASASWKLQRLNQLN